MASNSPLKYWWRPLLLEAENARELCGKMQRTRLSTGEYLYDYICFLPTESSIVLEPGDIIFIFFKKIKIPEGLKITLKIRVQKNCPIFFIITGFEIDDGASALAINSRSKEAEKLRNPGSFTHKGFLPDIENSGGPQRGTRGIYCPATVKRTGRPCPYKALSGKLYCGIHRHLEKQHYHG